MPIAAAVPSYLWLDFRDASPGLRFGMYLKLWNSPNWAKSKDKPLDAAKSLNPVDKSLMAELFKRQQQGFETLTGKEDGLCLPALATAPFTTGLGNEHPLENGFAFLNPYGLPYLPGSGVKGVLRQAARELARDDWGETHGWDKVYPHPKSLSRRERDLNAASSPSGESEVGKTESSGGQGLSAIDALFGSEDADKPRRGALSFWDVIPQIKGESLMVEIMTPHQGHYYQQNPAAGSTSPHDSGQPVPIPFLTVPPGSAFTFHVVCDRSHLERIAPELARDERWQTLLTAAFEHAFTWCGFGAKTAVGYGAMQRDELAEKQAAERLQQQAHEHRRAEMSEEERLIEDLRQLFENEKAKGPLAAGGEVSSERIKLLDAAVDWGSAACRAQAEELLSEIAKALPWPKKRKQEAKEKMDWLRQ